MFHLVSDKCFRLIQYIPEFEGNLQECVILLVAIIGDSYSITFGDGLVTVKPQPVTSNLRLLEKTSKVNYSGIKWKKLKM